MDFKFISSIIITVAVSSLYIGQFAIFVNIAPVGNSTDTGGNALATQNRKCVAAIYI